MSEKDAIEYSIERMMFPIVKLLIDSGVTHSFFSSITKRTFVKVAAQKLDEEEKKQRSNVANRIAKTIERRSKVPGSPDMPLNDEQLDELTQSLLESPKFVTLVRQKLRRFGVSELAIATVIDELPQAVKRSDSRISMMTGVPRREIGPLLNQRRPDSGAESQWYNHRCMRILNQWFENPRYLDKSGQPIALLISNQDMQRKMQNDSFETLVATVAKELSYTLVLSELEEAGCVKVEGNTVRAIKKRFERQGISTEVLVESADHFYALGMCVNARLREGDRSQTMEGMVTELSPLTSERNLILNALRRRAETFLSSGASTIANGESDSSANAGEKDERIGLGVFVFEGDDMADSAYFKKLLEEPLEEKG